MIDVGNGMICIGRFSIAHNFRKAANHKTIAFPLAISTDSRRVYVFIGPFTVVWIRKAYADLILVKVKANMGFDTIGKQPHPSECDHYWMPEKVDAYGEPIAVMNTHISANPVVHANCSFCETWAWFTEKEWKAIQPETCNFKRGRERLLHDSENPTNMDAMTPASEEFKNDTITADPKTWPEGKGNGSK